MRALPESAKSIIADHNSGAVPAGVGVCPNPRGWYHSVAGITDTGNGLVATYRFSDSHTAVYTHIMTAGSQDGGRTWSGHQSISHRNVWEHQSCWVAPQLTRLRDGRLVIICDEGQRTSGKDWPMLTRWQQRPERGMSNSLFWSSDDGRTWSGPQRIDEVGGEPGYITELADGSLIYTRTESNRYAEMDDPPEPWGDIYYRNTAVGSTDAGKTWQPWGLVTDSPYHGDSEVGTVELEPGHLLAITRIGFSGGTEGQPSRFVRSADGGRTWQPASLSPIYGQRTVVHKLQSGKLLVTYRNRWGTPATCAFVWDPREELGFEPTSFIWEPDRCRNGDGVLEIRAGSNRQREVEFSLYPVMTSSGEADLEVELRREPGSGAVVLAAGFGVRIDHGQVSLAHSATKRHESGRIEDAMPWDGPGRTTAQLDTAAFHRYRLERRPGSLRLLVDGVQVLATDDMAACQRVVRFGAGGDVSAQFRSASAQVHNPDDYSIEWKWDAQDGFPDQFQRDRMVVLDYTSDSGYSDHTQLEDGTIVIADYTSDHFSGVNEIGPQPVLKAYRTTEEELLG